MKVAYLAFDQSGKRIEDTIEVRNQAEAQEQLRKRGLYVTQIGAVRAHDANAAPKKRWRKGKGSIKKLAMFTRQFHILIATGTQIVDALESLERQITEPNWQQVIAEMRETVERGSSLSEAMAQHPTYFDPIYRNLVAAGEAAGKLTVILDQLAVLTRKQLRLRQNLIGALAYPAVLTLVAVVVLVMLLTVVVPNFTEMFTTVDMPLPPSTALVINLGNGLRSYWWAAIGLSVGLGSAFLSYLRTDRGRSARDAVLMRVPVIGQMLRGVITAHIARFLGILLDSHLPLNEALGLIREATHNGQYVALLARAEDQVMRGDPVSSAFSDANLITPSVYQAMRNGENTGRIAPSLLNVADFLDEENEVIVRSVGSVMEPVILVVLGLLVGGVALSMFSPLFDLTAAAGGPR